MFVCPIQLSIYAWHVCQKRYTCLWLIAWHILKRAIHTHLIDGFIFFLALFFIGSVRCLWLFTILCFFWIFTHFLLFCCCWLHPSLWYCTRCQSAAMFDDYDLFHSSLHTPQAVSAGEVAVEVQDLNIHIVKRTSIRSLDIQRREFYTSKTSTCCP